MKYKTIATVLFALMAAGCGSRPTYTPTTYAPPPEPASTLEAGDPIKLTPKQQQAVRAGVAKGMKDPESARFGDMHAAKNSKGAVTVCGYVNGKNSYGGYVGMSPFIGVMAGENSDSGFALLEIGSATDKRPIVAKICKDAGIADIS